MAYRVTVRDAEPTRLPGAGLPWDKSVKIADCNSPAHWTDGKLVVFSSASHPWRAEGPDLFHLGEPTPVEWDREANGGRWIEATFKHPNETLYGWYHNEPLLDVFSVQNSGKDHKLTAPNIGSCRSFDDGRTWEDMGAILTVSDDSYFPETRNYYFGGGNGDFSVIVEGDYAYLPMGLYNRKVEEQGVGWARLPIDRLDDPVGAAEKWFEGGWSQPGLKGRATPTWPAKGDWHSVAPDVYWGPSIHWNRHLNCYVILLNRAIGTRWEPGGIYVSFGDSLADPASWTEPEPILEGGSWYPVAYGLENGDTDKSAGEVARLYLGVESRHELVFG
ncbi:MAG TPA: hypothetical protein VGE01_01220 [Fimbriimonas sp.]